MSSIAQPSGDKDRQSEIDDFWAGLRNNPSKKLDKQGNPKWGAVEKIAVGILCAVTAIVGAKGRQPVANIWQNFKTALSGGVGVNEIQPTLNTSTIKETLPNSDGLRVEILALDQEKFDPSPAIGIWIGKVGRESSNNSPPTFLGKIYTNPVESSDHMINRKLDGALMKLLEDSAPRRDNEEPPSTVEQIYDFIRTRRMSDPITKSGDHTEVTETRKMMLQDALRHYLSLLEGSKIVQENSLSSK